MSTYWLVAVGWAVAGLILFWAMLSSQWSLRIKEHGHAVFFDSIVSMANRMHGFNIQPNYRNFKMSVLRHALVFFVSACILKGTISIRWLSILIVTLNGIYAFLACVRCHGYRTEAANSGMFGQELAGIANDSVIVVVHAVISVCILFVLLKIA